MLSDAGRKDYACYQPLLLVGLNHHFGDAMAIRLFRKTLVTIAGFLIILGGIAMLVLPGPGIITIIAGLALLGTEYHWARRALDPVRRWLDKHFPKDRKKPKPPVD